LKHLKKSVYWLFAESKVLRDAKAVIYTSEDEQGSSKNAFFPYQMRDVVCSLGISEPPSNEEEQRAEFQARFPSVQGKRIILFLGRLHCKKGCDLLIRAFAEVYRDQSEMVLVMAGPEGEVGYESELRNLAKTIFPHSAERVLWTGMLNGDLKWGALRSAELFVLPSHQENFGMAVVESLACGTPVFVSNRVNIWREIEEVGAGIVEEDTLKGVSKGLSRWIKLSPERINEYKRNTVQLFENKFKIQDSIRKLNKIISS